MSEYAIVNLLDLDDVVNGRVPGLEGRFARSSLGARDIGVSHFRYGPNTRGGSHRLDDELRDVRQWDVVRVAPGVVRAFESGADGLDVIAVGGPKPEGGDGVMSDRPWPDDA